jgi:CheY-like chemotaxis protein
VAKVLVVDDDEDIRRLVERRLGGAGHRVAVAAHADEALALIEDRGAPELVILDVAMPGMTGLELLDALRQQPTMEALPAIFLSARVRESDIEQGRQRGAVYLTKPFVANALLASVDKLLTGSSEAASGW